MKFRREDNGEIVDLPYEVGIRHSYGWITLEDGVQAKKVSEKPKKRRLRKELRTGSRPIYSDKIGFGQHQWADFEADRVANGFTDVEFVRDPTCHEFFQVKCGSRETFNKYARHRGVENMSSFGGVRFAPGELERAEAFVKERHGCSKSIISSD